MAPTPHTRPPKAGGKKAEEARAKPKYNPEFARIHPERRNTKLFWQASPARCETQSSTNFALPKCASHFPTPPFGLENARQRLHLGPKMRVNASIWPRKCASQSPGETFCVFPLLALAHASFFLCFGSPKVCVLKKIVFRILRPKQWGDTNFHA